jgi:hypothetical protein
MKQIGFFATGDDLRAVLQLVEQDGPIVYTRTGRFPEGEQVSQFATFALVPNLGVATSDSSITSESWLVSEPTVRIERRLVPQVDGTVSAFFDQLINPDTIHLTPGGLRGGALISGRVGTASESPSSKLLMSRFASAIRKRFKKLKSYYVGPAALAMLVEGSRLTDALQSPPEYDLKPLA